MFYGFSHQRSINAAQRAAAEKHQYEHKQQLIQKAKEEFARKKNPASASTTGGREYFPRSRWQSFGFLSFVGREPGEMQSFYREPQHTLTNIPVNQDPMDPKFDLEAFFDALVKEKS